MLAFELGLGLGWSRSRLGAEIEPVVEAVPGFVRPCDIDQNQGFRNRWLVRVMTAVLTLAVGGGVMGRIRERKT